MVTLNMYGARLNLFILIAYYINHMIAYYISHIGTERQHNDYWRVVTVSWS